MQNAQGEVPVLVAFAWIVPSDLAISFIKGPYMDPGNPEAERVLPDILAETIGRGSRTGVGSLQGRAAHPVWSLSFARTGFNKIGEYEKHRLFPLKGSVEVVEAPNGTEIRSWRGRGDLDSVGTLFKQAFAGNWDYVPVETREWEEIVRDKLFDSSLALLALDRGRPVGYIYGRTFTDPSALTLISAYLISVAVAQDRRGKGIGKALLSRWLRACYDAGARAAYLDVDVSNVAAKKLYGKFGFSFVRSEEVWVYRYGEEESRAMENA